MLFRPIRAGKINIDLDQYNGKGFTNVVLKGGDKRDFIPVKREARQVLEEWITVRGDEPGPIFCTRTGKRLGRKQLHESLQRIVNQANSNVPENEKIKMSPHTLRHTFLRKLADEKGLHYAMKASGHKSGRYIWRYVTPNEQTLAEAIDDLD